MTREGKVVPFTEVEVEAAKRKIHVEKRIGEKVGAISLGYLTTLEDCDRVIDFFKAVYVQ